MSFIEFWELANLILRSHGQDDLLYGEARDWWNSSQNKWAA